MFLSYKYKGHVNYDAETKLYRYQYKIIDSDFEVVGVAIALYIPGAYVLDCGAGPAVIQEYSKRNLNVVANLIRAFQYSSKLYGYSVVQNIEWNKKYNLEFHKYEKELEKYLILV